MIFQQWTHNAVSQKVVFPIAKNKVIGVTKVSDDTYDYINNHFNLDYFSGHDLYIWTLTADDYIVAVDRKSNTLIPFDKEGITDYEFYCFICY